jgi:hypothetical protein
MTFPGLLGQEFRSKAHKTSSAALSTSTCLLLEVHLQSNFTSLLDDALLAGSIRYLAVRSLVVKELQNPC